VFILRPFVLALFPLGAVIIPSLGHRVSAHPLNRARFPLEFCTNRVTLGYYVPISLLRDLFQLVLHCPFALSCVRFFTTHILPHKSRLVYSTLVLKTPLSLGEFSAVYLGFYLLLLYAPITTSSHVPGKKNVHSFVKRKKPHIPWTLAIQSARSQSAVVGPSQSRISHMPR